MAIKRSTVLSASAFLKTIGHPIRTEILLLLNEKTSLNVTQISRKLKSEQSLVSHHLAKLRNNGIVNTRRDGLQISYSLSSTAIVRLLLEAASLATALGREGKSTKRKKST